MVTQNKTWRFSKRIKMITIMCGGRALAALRPRRSNIITPENSPSPLFRQYNQRGLHYHYQGEGEREGEFSGVMILLREVEVLQSGSSATHYSYHFIRLENRHVLFVSPYLLV